MSQRSLLCLALGACVICFSTWWRLSGQSPAVPTGSQSERAASTKSTRHRRRSEPAPHRTAPREPHGGWKQEIDAILSSDIPAPETARSLIHLIPLLPAEGRAAAAQHLAVLLPDKDYDNLLPLLKDPSQPEEVLAILIKDLMNRDDPVKLPGLLEIAKIPNHPRQAQALTDLGIILDANNGTDWAKWEMTLKAYFKKQHEASGSEGDSPALHASES